MDPAPAADPDAQRALIQRVAGSVVFQKTWRLRELFLFLCDRVRRDPEHAPREQEIGAAVFGRDDFDPSADPLVRVQTSQLRKRLHQYFTTEGASEPVIIEIPRGAYVPVFRERGLALPEPPPAEEEPALAPARTRQSMVLGLLCLVLLAAAGLAFQNFRLRQAASRAEPRPTVEKLWRQIMGTGQTTYVVLADASLSVFLDTTQRVLSSAEYQRKRYDARYRPEPERAIPTEDPPDVVFSRELMQEPLTSVSDATLAQRAGAMSAALGTRMETVFARDATPDHFKSHNLVLSGPRRANPWIELFEQRLNFRLHYDRPLRVAYFSNAASQAGEAERYAADGGPTAYCRVAFLANLDQTGSVLELTGTDMAATAAGVELVTDERALADLASALGVGESQLFPKFEVLLKVHFVVDAPLRFERVAHRVHSAPAP